MGSVHLLLDRLLLGDILPALLHRGCILVVLHLHQRLACQHSTLSRLAQAEVPPVNVNLQSQEVSARRPLQEDAHHQLLAPLLSDGRHRRHITRDEPRRQRMGRQPLNLLEQ